MRLSEVIPVRLSEVILVRLSEVILVRLCKMILVRLCKVIRGSRRLVACVLAHAAQHKHSRCRNL